MLDLRRGVLERHVVWRSPAGKQIRLDSTRLVSLTRRSILAIRYRVTAVDEPVRVVVQSLLVANEPVPTSSGDPRGGAGIDRPLEAVLHEADGTRAHLVHRTKASGLNMAAAMSHVIDCERACVTETVDMDDWARFTAATSLEPGEVFEMTKLVGYGWSAQRSVPALRDQVDAAMLSASHAGWDKLLGEQEQHFADFWDGADVEIDGSPEIQRAVRFGIFHAYQAGARAEQRAIPAKGLTGPGYDGHAFWDTEMFVLPLLTATAPHAAADAVRWRLSTIDAARDRARTLRLRGAMFPWRTISGEECSAYWPAGTAAVHINADIAAAAARYVWWTGDTDFERDVALPILAETARLWKAQGYDGDDGAFHIDGVTGPDEYTAVIDDNTYTNLMAKKNLAVPPPTSPAHTPSRGGAAGDRRTPRSRRWADAGRSRMAVPYSDDARRPRAGPRVHAAQRSGTSTARNRNEEYPLLLHAPYFDLYRQQVIKQADLVLAMHWAGDEFTPEQKEKATSATTTR